MSRIGRQPIIIPPGTRVNLDGHQITVSGPKGQLDLKFNPVIKVEVGAENIQLSIAKPVPAAAALFGTTRNLIANMVEGVNNGFTKKLQIVGTGYRAQVEGDNLVLKLGFSHPVNFPIPEGINIDTPEKDILTVSGIDKAQVGQVAARIRNISKPEPYKGKGIRYEGEYIRKKAGKTGKTGVAGGAPAA